MSRRSSEPVGKQAKPGISDDGDVWVHDYATLRYSGVLLSPN